MKESQYGSGVPDFIRRCYNRLFPHRVIATPQSIPKPFGPPRGWQETSREPANASLNGLLDEIERTALAIYQANDLPIRAGHYAWSKKDNSRWRYLAEELTAEQRWEFIIANSNKTDWQFGRLQDLGGRDPNASPLLREAARLLAECRALRVAVEDHGGPWPNVIEAAIRAGADWRKLSAMAAPAYTEGSKLTFVQAEMTKKPRIRRKPKPI